MRHSQPARGQQQRSNSAALPAETSEYGFLLGPQLDAATLAKACAIAKHWGVHPHDVLISTGYLTEEDYTRALGAWAGVPVQETIRARHVTVPGKATLRQCLSLGLLKERGEPGRLLVGLKGLRPLQMRALLQALAQHPIALVCPSTLRRALRARYGLGLARDAVQTLAVRRPHLSAHRPATAWQLWIAILTGLAVIAALVLAPSKAVQTGSLLLACVFTPLILFRLLAALALANANPDSTPAAPTDKAGSDRTGASLPVYTILVPLYREAHMLQPILHALSRLDWPRAKLDIKLVLEAADVETVATARAMQLPPHAEMIVVPDMGPRTKPKALNYALPFARGDYLVVYDAEDRPDPGQLRQAYAAFRGGPPNLTTVQARLNIYNADSSWLTRQFTIEYSALFDGLLPFLDRLHLPIPLGGTSNHFRVATLKWLLGWDPFNVTEDADLGTRLARCGYRCSVIGSTTYEEAPIGLGSWVRQRTRWLKGFVQTWLVHMRSPRTLLRELGFRGSLAFHIMIGGTILSALVHPWFYVLLAGELANGHFLAAPETALGLSFWTISIFSLAAGYGASMALALLALQRRGLHRLMWQVPVMPLYWLLISLAAYRALWHFAVSPFTWEKTEHGIAAQKPTAQD